MAEENVAVTNANDQEPSTSTASIKSKRQYTRRTNVKFSKEWAIRMIWHFKNKLTSILIGLIPTLPTIPVLYLVGHWVRELKAALQSLRRTRKNLLPREANGLSDVSYLVKAPRFNYSYCNQVSSILYISWFSITPPHLFLLLSSLFLVLFISSYLFCHKCFRPRS